jgi:hypothetical protein
MNSLTIMKSEDGLVSYQYNNCPTCTIDLFSDESDADVWKFDILKIGLTDAGRKAALKSLEYQYSLAIPLPPSLLLLAPLLMGAALLARRRKP